MRRMFAVLALAFLTLMPGTETSQAEITYPWCAQYGGGRGGSRNCGFWTYEQCMAAISGNGGYCETNAMYRPSPGQIPPPPGMLRPRGSW